MSKDLCNGCGVCADACREGAIAMVDGKAGPAKDGYCDELGDCLPTCPTGAIVFEGRETAAHDEAAAEARMHQSRNLSPSDTPFHRECPEGRLTRWPVQIKLAPVQAPCSKDARLLIAANCTVLTYGNFHNGFIAGRTTLIGCLKLDMVDYSGKLMEIIRLDDIRGAAIVRMEVPCYGGIESAAKRAFQANGKFIPWQVVTVRTDGSLVRN